MLMKCLFRSVLRGDVVKPGRVLDLTADECGMDVVKRFFARADGAAENAAAAVHGAGKRPDGAAGLVAGLTREQVVMKLAQAGVKVRGNATNAALAALYGQTFANIAEAAAK